MFMALTKEQITKFKNRLEELKAQMTHLIRDTIEDVRATDEIKGYSQHQADEGTDDFNRTINLQLSGNEREILQKIEVKRPRVNHRQRCSRKSLNKSAQKTESPKYNSA